MEVIFVGGRYTVITRQRRHKSSTITKEEDNARIMRFSENATHYTRIIGTQKILTTEETKRYAEEERTQDGVKFTEVFNHVRMLRIRMCVHGG